MLLQDCKSAPINAGDRGERTGLGIRLMWDGGLSDAVKERFDALKKHLTPPPLNGEGNARSLRHLREG